MADYFIAGYRRVELGFLRVRVGRPDIGVMIQIQPVHVLALSLSSSSTDSVKANPTVAYRYSLSSKGDGSLSTKKEPARVGQSPRISQEPS